MNIKLIAVDLDGTLVEKGNNVISKKNKQAIKKAIDQGIIICIATGRSYKASYNVYDKLKLDTPVITNAGALIVDNKGETIYENQICSEDTHALINFAVDHHIYCQIYKQDDVYYYESNEEFDKYAKMYHYRTGLNVIADETIINDKQLITPKMIFMDKHDMHVTELQLKKNFPHLSVKGSLFPYLEVMNKSVSKGNALKIVADMYGINMNETMAIGDTEIDKCMILDAAIGVAMGDGSETAKDVADYVTLDFDKDGLAHAIEKFCFE